MSSRPQTVYHASQFWCWGKVGCGGLKQNRAVKQVQIIGRFASAGWQRAHFILFYVASRIVRGEEMEKDAEFPHDGFWGNVDSYIREEEGPVLQT